MDFENSTLAGGDTIYPDSSDLVIRIDGTGGFKVPAGTTGERPSTNYAGLLRYNSTTSLLEYNNGTAYVGLQNNAAKLDNLVAVATNGLTVLNGSGWTTVTITGTANQIAVTNGDGTSGNPTLAIASNAILPGTTGLVLPTGNTAQETGSTDGMIRYNSQTNKFRARENGSWVDMIGGSGSATASNLLNVRAASTANVTVSSAPSSIDGVTLASGELVLLKNQSSGAENGVYTFNGAASALTRAPSLDSSAEAVPGLLITVSEGTINRDTIWMLTTNAPITLGTTALTFLTQGAGYDTTPKVRVASTANVSISSAPSSIDGVTLASGELVLLKNQSTGAENGVYVFNGSGSAMTRDITLDSSAKAVPGMLVISAEGTANADKIWMLTTNAPITLGSTALTFTAFSGGGGGASSLDAVTAAVADATIANGDNNIVWNWQKTTDAEIAFTVGESAASTGGSSTQTLAQIGTLPGSTANPLIVKARGVDIININKVGQLTLSSADGSTNGLGSGSWINATAGDGNSTGDGGSVVLTGGQGGSTSGSGGAASLIGGAAQNDGDGGEATLRGGEGEGTGFGGSASVRGGNTNTGTGQGGGVNIGGGNSFGGDGGDLYISGGDAGTGSNTGGAIDIIGGTGGSTGPGGNVSLISGYGGSTSGASGTVTISSGNTTSGASGNIGLQTGSTASGVTGNINVTVGNPSGSNIAGILTLQGGSSRAAQVGNSGGVVLRGGNAGAVASINGGPVILSGGTGSTTTTGGVGGAVSIVAGQGGLAASGGEAVLRAGAGGTTGAGGILYLEGGAGGNTSGNGGNAFVVGGNAESGTAGNVEIAGGDVFTAGVGGSVTIRGGNNAGAGAGPSVSIRAGTGGATGYGGDVYIDGGIGGSTSGNGGNVGIQGGDSTSGNGGIASLAGGVGSGAGNNGGNTVIEGGEGVSSALGGSVFVVGGNSDLNAGGINLTGGDSATTGLGGPINIAGGTGGSTSGDGGEITITGGAGGSSGASGGGVTISGGTSVFASGYGGNVGLLGGNSDNGGDINLIAGTGSAVAGITYIKGGYGSGVVGGAVNITGGASSDGNGGDVSISGGDATIVVPTGADIGGNLVLKGGLGGSTGAGGKITLQTAPTNTLVTRLEILANGAWSVGTAGTNTGSSGQVLTSNGSSSAPTWQTPSGGGGGGTRFMVPLDFGSVGKNSASFSIADGSVTTSDLIQMTASPSTANSALGGDELEMDNFTCAAYCATNGTITAYISATNGAMVKGIRNFVYTY